MTASAERRTLSTVAHVVPLACREVVHAVCLEIFLVRLRRRRHAAVKAAQCRTEAPATSAKLWINLAELR